MPNLPEVKPALSLQQAANLFDSLANRQDLALGFVRTTCYPKAYMACEMALEQGHEPDKAWAFEEPGKPLAGQHPSGGQFKWWFHVGMALPVQTAPGKVEPLVFDPTLFDGPVRMDEWRDKIGAAPHKTGIFNYQTPPTALAGNAPPMSAAHTPSMTERAQHKLAEWAHLEPRVKRLVFASKTMRGLQKVVRAAQIGWGLAPEETAGSSLPAASRAPARLRP